MNDFGPAGGAALTPVPAPPQPIRLRGPAESTRLPAAIMSSRRERRRAFGFFIECSSYLASGGNDLRVTVNLEVWVSSTMRKRPTMQVQDVAGGHVPRGLLIR